MPDLLGMKADPEGRFLLLLTRTASGLVELHQQALVPQVSLPQVLATSVQYPELADAEHINVIERDGYGRTYYVGRSMVLPCLVLQDVANSGVFDSITGMSATAFLAAYPQGLWSSPFH